MRLGGLAFGLALACGGVGDDPLPDGGAADGGTPGTTSTDGGATTPIPLLLAPTEPAGLFSGTRYDVLVRAVEPASAALTLDGQALDCQSLGDDLWCPTTFDAGVHELDYADATGAAARFRLTVRDHQGVAPRGTALPLGMYHVNRFSGFRELEENGYTLAQSYATGLYEPLEWQAEAGRAGLYTMLQTSWDWEDPWGEPFDADTLAAFAALPQGAWWELPDNVTDDTSQLPVIRDWVDGIRAVDDRPVAMYFWTSASTEALAAHLPWIDILAPGAYPEHACQPQPWIRWRIESAAQAIVDSGIEPTDKLVLGLADLYGIPDPGCEAATLEQVWMNPIAMLIAGAEGILYFAWYIAQEELDPAWFDSALRLGRVLGGEDGLGEAVLHGEALGEVEVLVLEGPELSEAFRPAGAATEVQYPSLHAAAWSWQGTRFLAVVNYTDEPVTFELAGAPEGVTFAARLGEEGEDPVVGGRISTRLEGHGARIWRAPER